VNHIMDFSSYLNMVSCKYHHTFFGEKHVVPLTCRAINNRSIITSGRGRGKKEEEKEGKKEKGVLGTYFSALYKIVSFFVEGNEAK